MWRVAQFARPCWRRVGANMKAPKVTLALSISLAGSSLALSPLSLSSTPKTVDTASQTSLPPTITTPPHVPLTDANKKADSDLGWQPTLSDVMHVTKLLLVGGIVWGITGTLIGVGLFKALATVGIYVTRWVSIPACIFSGVGLSVLGLHRGLGHSLIYFINKGLAGHALRKILPKGATEYSVIHWDAAVSRVTYSFKMKAKKSGFFAGMILRSLARRLDSYLLLVKDEDKLQKRNHLSEDVINRKLTKVIKRQMQKPLYIIGAVYGTAISAVAYLVWRGN